LGFGKRMFGFRRGVTDYRISVLPLGGYVRMAGENPGDELTGSPDEFLSKPRWQRFVVAIAGPAMNILLAIGLLVIVYMVQFPRNSYLDQSAVVAAVESNTPAAQAGIEAGDRILRIDGVNNPTWEQVGMQAAVSTGHPIEVDVLRQGKIIQTHLTPPSPDSEGNQVLGLVPRQEVVIEAIDPGSAAAKAGLKAGDRIVAINHTPVLDPGTLVKSIHESAGNPVAMTVLRQGQTIDKSITPKTEMQDGQRQYRIGVALSSGVRFVSLSFPEAIKESLRSNRQSSMLILDLLGKLVAHRASITSLQGPIGIATLTGEAVRQPTLVPLVWITSMISLNLGILNLLPIPVLDGGMILFLLIEGLLRRDLSLRVKERVYQLGAAFLLILMTVVVYNDIIRIVHQ
jgi:regulator of sigma E protease